MIVNNDALKSLDCSIFWQGRQALVNAPKTVTTGGTAILANPVPGSGVGYYNGTNAYNEVVDSEDWDFGTQPFTIRFWMTNTDLGSSTSHGVISRNGTGAYTPFLIDTYGTSVYFLGTSNGTSWDIASNKSLGTAVLNVAAYYEVTRSGNTFYCFRNGILTDTWTSSGSFYPSTSPLSIGRYNTSTYMAGFISDLEILNVTGHTSNYKPPTRSPQITSNTKLLMRYAQTGTSFVDSSANNYTITAYGGVKSVAPPVNGGGMLYLTGGSSYISVTAPSDINNGINSDWTFELFVNPDNIENLAFFFNTGASVSGNATYCRMWSNGSLMFVGYNGAYATQITTANNSGPALGVWSKLVIMRSGAYAYVIKDGVIIGKGSAGTYWVSARNFIIGQNGDASGANLYGYVSGIRWTNSAVYTGGNVGDTVFSNDVSELQSLPNTKLLLHCNTNLKDYSDSLNDNGFRFLPPGCVATPAGTFAKELQKSGSYLAKFDGSTNYIVLSITNEMIFGSNDFTICLWVRVDSVSVLRNLFHLASASGYGLRIYANTTSKFGWCASSGDSSWNLITLEESGTFTLGEWYFITFTRNKLVMEGRKNLVLEVTSSSSGAIITPTSACIGKDSVNAANYHSGITGLLAVFNRYLDLNQLGQIMAETYMY